MQLKLRCKNKYFLKTMLRINNQKQTHFHVYILFYLFILAPEEILTSI